MIDQYNTAIDFYENEQNKNINFSKTVMFVGYDGFMEVLYQPSEELLQLNYGILNILPNYIYNNTLNPTVGDLIDIGIYIFEIVEDNPENEQYLMKFRREILKDEL